MSFSKLRFYLEFGKTILLKRDAPLMLKELVKVSGRVRKRIQVRELAATHTLEKM